ncbi:MAG: hypothetical protein OEW00_14190, partial [candidate division Zixibacteria bacterium]|nr:hypothetical protein [candidate division Zixibacteria bacterium]
AVVAGPYAATLTVDNGLKSIIHFFVSSSDLLAQYPVTHLALDRASWEKAAEQYPVLQEAKSVARYWIRDFEVLIFNVSEISDNPAARVYVPSPVEKAMTFFYQNKDDSALAELSRIGNVRRSKTAGLLHMLIMQRNNNSKEALATLLSLAETFPTDFFLQYQCAQYMKNVAEYSSNPALGRRAETFFQRASHANPFRIKKEGGRWGLAK